MKRTLFHVVSLAAAAVMMAGCTHVYDTDYRWTPRPASFTLDQGPATAANPVDISISVIGLRTRSKKIAHPGTLEVAMRVQNQSAAPVTIPPGSFQLLTADLVPLPTPQTQPAGPLTVPPHSTRQLTAYFPVSPQLSKSNTRPLDGLSLRWSATVGNRTVSQTVSFNRKPLYYYYGYPYNGWYGPEWDYGYYR